MFVQEVENDSSSENLSSGRLSTLTDYTPICKNHSSIWSSDETTLIDISLLSSANPLVYEYLHETEWLASHLQSLSNYSDLSVDTLVQTTAPESSLPTATFMYKPHKRRHRRVRSSSLGVSNRSDASPCHSVVLLPSTSSYQRGASSCSLCPGFDAFTPNALQRAMFSRRVPKTIHAILSTTRPLRHRYGDFYQSNSNLYLDFSLEENQSLTTATSGGTASTQVTTAMASRNTATIRSLLLDPMMPITLPAILQNLKSASQWNGVYSPLSPVPQETAHPSGGAQPMHVQRNRAPYCSLHQSKDSSTQLIQSANASRHAVTDMEGNARPSLAVWSWDKEEPLSLLGLCSCDNEELSKIWEEELTIHRRVCMPGSSNSQNNSSASTKGDPSTTTSSKGDNKTSSTLSCLIQHADLDDINWPDVDRGDFSSFLSSINSLPPAPPTEYTKLHFCGACGGLTYIPFSFIEICLNREVASLTDLARKLPLPIGTDIYCDGMRSTACLATRTRLHEWLIMKTLASIDLDRTARAYQVCSMFIYPFYKSVYRSPPSVATTLPACARHNLIHAKPPAQWVVSDPRRFVQLFARRPYCLTRRLPLADADFKGTAPSFLLARCEAWLKKQSVVEPNSTSPLEKAESIAPAGKKQKTKI